MSLAMGYPPAVPVAANLETFVMPETVEAGRIRYNAASGYLECECFSR